MTYVLKYKLKLAEGEQVVLMPDPAKIVAVGIDGDQDVCLWAQTQAADREQATQSRRFQIVPTGREAGPGWVYVGTAFDSLVSIAIGFANQKVYVWHVFERPESQVVGL